MSEKITREKSIFQWFCWYLLVLSIVNVIVIAILIWNSYDFNIPDNFNGTILAILSILACFIAFTAINMYSVFNSRVEDEKQKLKELREKCYEDMKNLEERFIGFKEKCREHLVTLEEEFDNFGDKIKQNLQDIDNYNLMDDIFDIKNNDALLEKVRAIYALTERIEIIKKSIGVTDSIKEKERLEENLMSLKNRIKLNLEPYYRKIIYGKNQTFKDIFNDFKELLDEEDV